ncbi:hypothetical protein [Cobetia marina]|uniref:hypothetical protein n=1 Tax=Cobetia marina TaxID=28258 RepID=UPI0012F48A15|nr:hypothetical protein [Cobetia marina]
MPSSPDSPSVKEARSRAISIRLAGRSIVNLRQRLGAGALSLMLGSVPAYANGIEDLPPQHRLSASTLGTGLDDTRREVAALATASRHSPDSSGSPDSPSSPGSPDRRAAGMGNDNGDTTSGQAAPDSQRDHESSHESSRLLSTGLAPELLTQLMMRASHSGMRQFSGMDIVANQVRFTGWGRDGWEMELSINRADGELIDEALRRQTRQTEEGAMGRNSLRQTLNFAASDGIERIRSVDVEAHAIRIVGLDGQGRQQTLSLSLPTLASTMPGG